MVARSLTSFWKVNVQLETPNTCLPHSDLNLSSPVQVSEDTLLATATRGTSAYLGRSLRHIWASYFTVIPPTHCGKFRPPGPIPAGAVYSGFLSRTLFPIWWSTTASCSWQWSITAYLFYREDDRTPLPHHLASGHTFRTPQRACQGIRPRIDQWRLGPRRLHGHRGTRVASLWHRAQRDPKHEKKPNLERSGCAHL